MPGCLQVSRGSFQREGQSYAPLSCCTLARDGAAESHSCLSLRRTDAREGLTQHAGTLHLQRGHKTARGTEGPNPALQRIQALPRAWCALEKNKGSPGLRAGRRPARPGGPPSVGRGAAPEARQPQPRTPVHLLMSSITTVLSIATWTAKALHVSKTASFLTEKGRTHQ